MSAVESRLYKITKKRIEPFGFFHGSYSVEHMRMSKIVDFKVAFIEKPKKYNLFIRGLFRAWPNNYDEGFSS